MSSMTDRHIDHAAKPLADVTRFFEEILAEISTWVPAVANLFLDTAQRPTTKAVNAITEPLAAGVIHRGEWPVVGAGFVAVEHTVADATWHMAWWQGEAMERLVLLTVASASDAYMRREWFTRPMETGHAHVTGPYVDFLCTDEYTMTMTVPVTARGRRVGVAGADVFVESLEPLLLPALENLHPAASLVNHGGRVIVSSDAQVAAGTLLAPGAVTGTAVRPMRPVEGASPLRTATGSARTIEPKGHQYAGKRLTVLPCDRLPLAVVFPTTS